MQLLRTVGFYVLIVAGISALLGGLGEDFTFADYEVITALLGLYCLTKVVLGLGKRIILPEIISLVAVLEVLFVPVVHYRYAPAAMPIAEADYFTYALPAVVVLVACLDYFSGRTGDTHRAYFDQIKEYLRGKSLVGFGLIGVGMISSVGMTVAPIEVKNILHLFESLLFVGVLYVVFSDSRQKLAAVGLALLTLAYQAVRGGMFGDLIFWAVLYVVVILAGMSFKLPVPVKLGLLLAGFFGMLVIQSIKFEYRRNTWGLSADERRGDAGLMNDLLVNRMQHLDVLLNPDLLLLFSMRFNQGFYIGQTIGHVPQYEPYANGEVLVNLVAPVVPRLLWPDKPLSNGMANVHRFTPTVLKDGHNVDISPIGEGYANFGRWGGIGFVLLYGTLLGFVYRRVFVLADQTPTVLLWLPKLFFTCMTMETSLFASWGGLAQSLIFVFLLYKIGRAVGLNL